MRKPAFVGVNTRLSYLLGSLQSVAFILAVLWTGGSVRAADFFCSSGNVTCLIAAINAANGSPDKSTIFLEAGKYMLTTVDNFRDGPNGLPSVITPISIRGSLTDNTIIEGDPRAPVFRIFHVGPTGNLMLEDVTVMGGDLGPTGINLGAGILSRGTLALLRSELTENNGGALLNLGSATLMDSIVENNLTVEGGTAGISNFGTISILRSSIRRNTGFTCLFCETAGLGGIDNHGIAEIRDSAIYDNTGQGGDGGILNLGSMTITNSTIARNGSSLALPEQFAGAGGIRSFTTFLISNSAISENYSDGSGGGIVGPVELQNVILANNSAAMFGPDCVGNLLSRGNNIVGDTSGCNLNINPTDLVGDPKLDEFRDEVRAGRSHYPLLFGSPAIDSASRNACPIADQLGLPRVGVCDIGSVEFQGGRMVVSVDIRPRKDANRINPSSSKNINVAIFSANGFDAANVEPNSVRFGATGTEAASIHVARRDFDGDGIRDMVLRFQILDTGIKCGDTSAILTGQLSSGPSFIGSSPINTVQCRNRDMKIGR